MKPELLGINVNDSCLLLKQFYLHPFWQKQTKLMQNKTINIFIYLNSFIC